MMDARQAPEAGQQLLELLCSWIAESDECPSLHKFVR
jgi:hypothetical protein